MWCGDTLNHVEEVGRSLNCCRPWKVSWDKAELTHLDLLGMGPDLLQFPLCYIFRMCGNESFKPPNVTFFLPVFFLPCFLSAMAFITTEKEKQHGPDSVYAPPQIHALAWLSDLSSSW